MNAAFRNRLLAGEVLLGTLVSLPSAELVEILANLDYDWLFLDAEHGTFGHQDLLLVRAVVVNLNLLQGAGRRTPCLIRVLAADETSIKRALDAGAAGIIVPQVSIGAVLVPSCPAIPPSRLAQSVATIHAGHTNPEFFRQLRLFDAFGTTQYDCRPKAVAHGYCRCFHATLQLLQLKICKFNYGYGSSCR